MTILPQLVISGLITGAIYALVSLGLVVVYKATNVLNFAHGYISAVGAFVTLSLFLDTGLPLAVCVTIATLCAGLLAVLIEILIIDQLESVGPTGLLIATLGVGLILSGLINIAWGPSPKLLPNLANGKVVKAGGFIISWQDVILAIVTVALIGGSALYFAYSKVGVAMRAASEDRRSAALIGVRLRLVSSVSWALAGMLGSVSAVFVAPRISLTPDAFTVIMVQAFVAVVLAGLTNIAGAVIGGVVIGVGLNLFTGYVASGYSNTFLLVVLLGVLLVRPTGIFGGASGVRP